ncbi:substrate-binding domain-containing protein [Paraburkholderia acidicola]|nr:substrate-binding domain-containing protein [Paraburkholderia acidicola]
MSKRKYVLAAPKVSDVAHQRPTMEMVAELAGVSKITVSRALRDSDLVRPEVRERIAEVAREIGYRLNTTARSLRTQRTHTIAVVIEKLVDGDRPATDPILLLVLGSLLESLAAIDHVMLVTTSDLFLASNNVSADGVIMLGQGERGGRAAEVAACGLPTVIWGHAGDTGLAVVGSDNRKGGELAASHLLEIGRKRFVFLGNPKHPEVASRLDGVRGVLAESSAMLVKASACDFSRPAGQRVIADLLDDGVQFDAVIAASDQIAAGACDALSARGVAIPGAVAVVGYDDSSIALSNVPPLTSVRQDWALAGRALVEVVLSLINNRESEVPGPLPVDLVVRSSTIG